jgi:hypothetical protein
MMEKPMPAGTLPGRHVRTLILSALVPCLFVLPETVFADADPPTAPGPGAGYVSNFGKTMDTAHARLEQNILAQTVRLDDFFGDVRTEDRRQTGYELRWRNSFRIEDGGTLVYGTSVRARFTLSRISERLRLIIAGEDEPTPLSQTLPQDPGNPGFDRTTPVAHFANTELRYELVRKPDMNLFLGAGVRLDLPFEAFVRSRFQYNHRFSDESLLRLAETLFVKNTDLLGETTEISLERLIDTNTILRWSSAGTASEEIRGLEWGSELSLIKGLQEGRAVTLTGGAYGNTTSSAVADNYRLLARYRSNFLRSWLFYELEPEIAWPRDRNGEFPATLALTFRVEVVFQGNSRHNGPLDGKRVDGTP